MLEIGEMFNNIRKCLKDKLSEEVNKLKKCHSKLRESIDKDIKQMGVIFKEEIKKIMIEIVKKSTSNIDPSPKYDTLSRRLNELDNELDYFIETELLL